MLPLKVCNDIIFFLGRFLAEACSFHRDSTVRFALKKTARFLNQMTYANIFSLKSGDYTVARNTFLCVVKVNWLPASTRTSKLRFARVKNRVWNCLIT